MLAATAVPADITTTVHSASIWTNELGISQFEAVNEFNLLGEDGEGTSGWGLLVANLSSGVGTVCNDGFNNAAASVICREMGYAEARAWYTSNGDQEWSMQADYPITLDDVSCPEPYFPFSTCTYLTEHNCGHQEDVFLRCSDADPPAKEYFYLVDFYGQAVLNTGLLLASGVGSPRTGTVCNDGFSDVVAHVICREMGYLRTVSWHYGNAWAVQYNYTIVLDDLKCVDPDSGFSACSYQTSHNCGHREDVFLTCEDKVVVFE